MRVTDIKYFEDFKAVIGKDIFELVENYKFKESSIDLKYRIKISAVFSSNIEGNSIDINSYMNSIAAKEKFKPGKEIEEINDLTDAYEFAIKNILNESNFLKAHRLLSANILIPEKQGLYRNDRMGVFDNTGLVYFAIEPEKVESEMKLFFSDISELIEKEMEIDQVFYHASLIHLKFVHIHPFWDGNGRMARLIEKWFLCIKLGEKFWKLNSEKYYKDNLNAYYSSIKLGDDYYNLNYDNCLNFLKMLPNSLKE